MLLKLEFLKAAMQLPGGQVNRRTVVSDVVDRPKTRPTNLPGPGRQAAVVALIYSVFERSQLLLIKRQSHLRYHANQIALPGGRQEPGEPLQHTAFRELSEEVGIAPAELKVVGQLDAVYVPPSDFTIHPFVAWHHGELAFSPDEAEVAEIIQVPLARLLDPACLTRGTIDTGDRSVQADYFAIDDYKVWGATAIVLADLADRIRCCGEGWVDGQQRP